MTELQGGGSEWVTGEQGEGSELVTREREKEVSGLLESWGRD
jgi:hypothetical protein